MTELCFSPLKLTKNKIKINSLFNTGYVVNAKYVMSTHKKNPHVDGKKKLMVGMKKLAVSGRG